MIQDNVHSMRILVPGVFCFFLVLWYNFLENRGKSNLILSMIGFQFWESLNAFYRIFDCFCLEASIKQQLVQAVCTTRTKKYPPCFIVQHLNYIDPNIYNTQHTHIYILPDISIDIKRYVQLAGGKCASRLAITIIISQLRINISIMLDGMEMDYCLAHNFPLTTLSNATSQCLLYILLPSFHVHVKFCEMLSTCESARVCECDLLHSVTKADESSCIVFRFGSIYCTNNITAHGCFISLIDGNPLLSPCSNFNTLYCKQPY